MDRRTLTSRRNRRRQRPGKPQTVSETPQREQTRMRRDLIATPCHPHITRAANLHLGDAPFLWNPHVLINTHRPTPKGLFRGRAPLQNHTLMNDQG